MAAPASTTPVWPAAVVAVIPVYDNVATVATVVAALRGFGAAVITVDDGSTDGSGAAAAAAGAEVVSHPDNRGKAAALTTGLAAAAARGYASAVTVDADGQHPPAMALALAQRAAERPDSLIIGERDMHHAPRASRVGRWWCNLGVRVACRLWPGDSQSGLRAYPVQATLALGVPATRYAFEVEVLVRATWVGIPVERRVVAVEYPPGRVSHFRAWRDSGHAARVLVRLWLCRLLRRTAPPASAEGWRPEPSL